ncbi:5903_t:CDS:2, partial [Dentiscutata heterogama]
TKTGLLRLTNEGSLYYEMLDETNKTYFFDILLYQLAQSIPIPQSRLIRTNEKVQTDYTARTYQILFEISILKTYNLSEKSSESILNDLDVLIKNKYITPINQNNFTKFLDELYGIKEQASLLDQLKLPLILFAILFCLIAAIILYSYIKRKKGNKFAIITPIIIIVDFIADITFIKQLYDMNLKITVNL